jgi:small-conductance mechanosensitive channel
MIKQTIDEQPLARFDRAHFASFGDFSLNFEVVFWVTSPAYPDFMDTTQAINLDIVRRFEAEGIEFAYPTQTVFVEKEEEESEKKKTEEEAKNKKEEDGS